MVKVTTNNRKYKLAKFESLPDDAKPIFEDYAGTDDSLRFFQYRNIWLDVYDFSYDPELLGWEGALWLGAISKNLHNVIAIQYSGDYEHVIVGNVDYDNERSKNAY